MSSTTVTVAGSRVRMTVMLGRSEVEVMLEPWDACHLADQLERAADAIGHANDPR